MPHLRDVAARNAFDWRQVLYRLEVPTPDTPPPFATICPRCRRATLTVRLDYLKYRPWLRCTGPCDFAGSLLSLTASTWELSREQTAERFEKAGLAASARSLLAEDASLWSRCRRTREFWLRSRELKPRGNAYLTALRLLGIGYDYATGPTWAAGAGRIIGLTTRHAINNHFKNNARCERLSKRGGLQTTLRNGGDANGSLLITPFQDLPGRVLGFLTLNPKGRVNYLPLVRAEMKRECGVGFLDLAPDDADAILAGGDALAIWGLHARRLRDGLPPLPFVASWEGASARTRALRSAVDGRRVVLVGTRETPGLYDQAIAADADVCFDSAAAIAAVGTPAAVREALIDRASPPSRRMRAGGPWEARDRTGRPPRRVIVPEGTVHRRHGQFWLLGDDRTVNVLADFTFTIDRVVYDRGVVLHYEGRAFAGDVGAWFRAPADFAAAPLAACAAKLAAIHPRARYNPAWEPRFTELVQLMDAPEIIRVSRTVGWSDADRAFHFPRFRLANDGEVIPVDRHGGIGAWRHLKPPLEATARRGLDFRVGDGAAMLACAAYVASRALAYRNERPKLTTSLSLRGRGADSVFHGARYFGCPRGVADARHRWTIRRLAADASPRRDSIFIETAAAPRFSQLHYSLDCDDSVMRVDPRWSWVIPWYLRDFLHRPAANTPPSSSLDAVVVDLGRALLDIGVPEATVVADAALRRLTIRKTL